MVYLTLRALNGLLFLAWVVVMFYTLFALRRRSVARTGKVVPGVGDTLLEWRNWWRDPDQKTARRVLIGLTFALVLSLVLMAAIAPNP